MKVSVPNGHIDMHGKFYIETIRSLGKKKMDAKNHQCFQNQQL